MAWKIQYKNPHTAQKQEAYANFAGFSIHRPTRTMCIDFLLWTSEEAANNPECKPIGEARVVVEAETRTIRPATTEQHPTLGEINWPELEIPSYAEIEAMKIGGAGVIDLVKQLAYEISKHSLAFNDAMPINDANHPRKKDK